MRPAHAGTDLPRLTSLRAFAAAGVFGFHMGHDTTWAPGGITFMHGFVGVGFFYVLSGFVLTWSTKPSSTPQQFWLRRFARVYPAYFVMFLIAFVVPVLAYPITAEGALANLFLVQAWFPQLHIAFGMNAVSWSLSCEAFFYLVAPFVIRWAHARSDKTILIVLGFWFAAMSAVALAMSTDRALDIYAFTLPVVRSGEFVLGIAAAFLVMRGRVPRIPVSVGVAAVGAMWWATNARLLPQSATDVLFALPFGLLVLAAATTDVQGRRGVLTSRALVYGGQVSYCFYLVHELVILNGERLWGTWATSTIQGAALTAAVFVIAFGCAAALHHLVELPAQKAIRRAAQRRTSRAA